jgi:hypothetical protein
MGTAFSTGLNGNGFFIWIEWKRLFHLGWMKTAFSSGLYENGFFMNCSWVIDVAGWSAQMGGRRRWVVGAAGWSTRWMVIDLFLEMRARLQQMLARIGTNRGFLPDLASRCQCNRSMMST